MDDYARALHDAVDAAVEPWVVASVGRVVAALPGGPPEGWRERAVRAGADARAELAPRLRAVLEADIDEQRTTPLSLVRACVSHPTALLRQLGVPPVRREAFAERAFPDDVYDLSPAAWVDLGPEVHEAGIAWGAWKAMQHLQRRRG